MNLSIKSFCLALSCLLLEQLQSVDGAKTAAHPTQTSKIEFVNKGMGEATSADGTWLAFTSYMTRDGVSLIFLHKEFADSDEARVHLENELHQAAKIVERDERKDKDGKKMTWRAVVEIRSNKPRQTTSAILWIDGRHFHEITCDSLSDALELEKRLRSPNSFKRLPLKHGA